MTNNFNDSIEKTIHECGLLLEKFVTICRIGKKHTFDQIKNCSSELSKSTEMINRHLRLFVNANPTSSNIDNAGTNDETINQEKGDDNDSELEIPIEKINVLNKLIQKHAELDALYYFLSNNLLVSIASNYDVFLNKILYKVLFEKKMYGLFEKNISLKEALSYSTHEDLISACIEETLSELMRKSHKEQIKWIEKSFSVDIINSFQEWKSVYTFFAMRNIIVHNDGIVSNEFLSNLRKNGIACEKYILGAKIEFSPEEFSKYIRCIIDFAIYLFSIILQKCFRDNLQIEKIDAEIRNIVYNFLCEEEYQQVISIVDNILKTNQMHSSAAIFEFNINKCIALKERKNDTYKKILGKLDWSNCDADFKMARAVLLDETDTAISIMKTLDKKEMIHAYVEWPLFKNFTKTIEFKKEFAKMYGVEFEEKLSTLSNDNSSYLYENKIIEIV